MHMHIPPMRCFCLTKFAAAQAAMNGMLVGAHSPLLEDDDLLAFKALVVTMRKRLVPSAPSASSPHAGVCGVR